ncbi:S-adenosyl-L-methionine-dependent methyltransferase [Spinellus fusiger]|nr:S-adenosyl-L-methionine-dependent methyltransferase [Spinellus fusiger]
MGSQLSKDTDSVTSGSMDSKRRRKRLSVSPKTALSNTSPRPTHSLPSPVRSRTTIVSPINHKVVLMTDQMTPLSSLSAAISMPRRNAPTIKVKHIEENRSTSSFTSDDEPHTPTVYSNTFVSSSPRSSTTFIDKFDLPVSPTHSFFSRTYSKDPTRLTTIVFDSNHHSLFNAHHDKHSNLGINQSSKLLDAIGRQEPTAEDTDIALNKWVYEYGAEKERDRQWRQHYVLKMIFGGNIQTKLDAAPKRILDSACGVGLWSLEMAQAYPDTQVIGLDLLPPMNGTSPLNDFPSCNSMGVAGLPNLTYMCADILGPLPFPDNSFDFIYQRDVATVVPAKHWPTLLAEFYRVLKPGGHLELVEYNLLFQRPGPVLALVNEWYKIAASTIGVDPHYIQSIETRLVQTGFEQVKDNTHIIPIGEWPKDHVQKQHGYMYKEQMKGLFKSMKKWWLSEIRISSEEYERVCHEALEEFDEHESSSHWKIFTCRKPLGSFETPSLS